MGVDGALTTDAFCIPPFTIIPSRLDSDRVGLALILSAPPDSGVSGNDERDRIGDIDAPGAPPLLFCEPGSIGTVDRGLAEGNAVGPYLAERATAGGLEVTGRHLDADDDAAFIITNVGSLGTSTDEVPEC